MNWPHKSSTHKISSWEGSFSRPVLIAQHSKDAADPGGRVFPMGSAPERALLGSPMSIEQCDRVPAEPACTISSWEGSVGKHSSTPVEPVGRGMVLEWATWHSPIEHTYTLPLSKLFPPEILVYL